MNASPSTKPPQPKPNANRRGSVTSKASGCLPTSVVEPVRSPPLTGAYHAPVPVVRAVRHRERAQPASCPPFPPSESARALLMRSVKNCPPWIPQKAVSRLIPIPHPWFVKDSALLFRLPGEWQVCSDRPLCRRLGNGQAATLLQSSILLKTCHYRDKISTCYCCAVPVPFQRLYKAFLRY